MGVMNVGLPAAPAQSTPPRTAPTVINTASSGTFVPKPGTKWLRVRGGGAGGGGGGGGAGSGAAGAPGAAGACGEYWVQVTKASYAYTVGAAGPGGTLATAGSTGGDTTFDTLTFYGGLGGCPGGNTAPDLNFTAPGPGQSTPYGSGGNHLSAAKGNCAAGGGGQWGSSGGGNGTSGAQGILIIEEY